MKFGNEFKGGGQEFGPRSLKISHLSLVCISCVKVSNFALWLPPPNSGPPPTSRRCLPLLPSLLFGLGVLRGTPQLGVNGTKTHIKENAFKRMNNPNGVSFTELRSETVLCGTECRVQSCKFATQCTSTTMTVY